MLVPSGLKLKSVTSPACPLNSTSSRPELTSQASTRNRHNVRLRGFVPSDRMRHDQLINLALGGCQPYVRIWNRRILLRPRSPQRGYHRWAESNAMNVSEKPVRSEPVQREQLLSRGGLPDTSRIVEASGRNARSIVAEGQVNNRSRVTFKRADLSSRRCLAKDNDAVLVADGNFLAGRTPSQGSASCFSASRPRISFPEFKSLTFSPGLDASATLEPSGLSEKPLHKMKLFPGSTIVTISLCRSP